MTSFSNLGPDASIGDILFSNPDRFGPFLAFTNEVMRGSGDLEPQIRELLAAYVSGLNESAFCAGVHDATAKRFGVEPSLLEVMLGDIEKAGIAADLKPIFIFARKLTLEPSKVADADRTAALDAGHSEEALKDVIAIVALFSFFNRLVDGHGVKGNEGLFERDSEMLFSFGYAPPQQ